MLKVGDTVKVAFPPGEQTVFDALKKLEGQETIITEDRYYRKTHSTTFHSFILAGCKSDRGIPYEFCEDWLEPIEEVEE